MTPSSPHYLLYTASGDGPQAGCWRFALRPSDGSRQIEAGDCEPGQREERLALLSVVRALEALDQASRITLVNPHRYVRDGIRFGLPEWRRSQWRWEYFGQMVQVRDHDLWRRVDRAMRFHEVTCRTYRVDGAHREVRSPLMAGRERRPRWGKSVLGSAARSAPMARLTACGRRLAAARKSLKARLRGWFASLKPCLRFG